MASWSEVRTVLERSLSTERVNDRLLSVTISLMSDRGTELDENGRSYESWQVYVSGEALPRKDGGAGLEFITVDAPIGAVGNVDLMDAVGHVGQLTHALLAYAQGTDGGTLSVGTRVPAHLIDAAHPEPFLMLLYSVADSARGVIPELGREDGFYAFRTEQIRESAWSGIRRQVQDDTSVAVERELGNNGRAFVLVMDGLKDPGRQHRMLVARNDRGPGEHYVTLEISFGPIENVDMPRAAHAAALTVGGVVYDDGFVSIRISHHLTAITYATFASAVIQLARAAEEYLGV
jgi:hypothetical protein